MDIFIVHEGQETGPFSENAARELLTQGVVAETDFAWREGMEKWLPLSELLASEKSAPIAGGTPPPPSEGKFEPATPKQKALLSFLGITFAADMSRDQAARRVNDAVEDSANGERLKLWNEDRLRLHPELFAAEIQAKKENRANHFLELCQTTGAKYFTGISKAHCQVLVGFLDVKFPNWDARESEAAEHYFFPAVAEKFPQLVHKHWRGRLRYAEGMKVAPEMVRQSPVSQVRQTATSPLVAVTRGVVLGLVILAVLYLGYRTTHQDATAAPSGGGRTPAADKSSEPMAGSVAQAPATTPEPAPPLLAATTPPEKLPSIDPVPPVASTEPVAVPTPAVASVPATVPAPTEFSLPPVGIPAPPPPAPAVAAVPGPDPAIVPPVPGLPPSPPADPTAPVATAPPAVAPVAMPSIPGLPPSPPADPAPVAGVPAPPPPAALPGTTPPADPTTPTTPPPSSALITAPMATLPGAEPAVPQPPPPATLPGAGTLPSTPTPATPGDPAVPGLPPSPPAAPGLVPPVPGLPPSLPGVPGLPPSPAAETPPGVPAGKTNLVLTKLVEVQLTYGKITLRPGTAVKLISRQGTSVKVSYGNNVITIPVASTDLE